MGGISDLLDSDMKDSVPFVDENSILSSASDAGSVSHNRQKQSQTKKATKKRHRVTMPKKSRVTKSAEDAPMKKPTKKAVGAKRQALEEQVNSMQEKRLDEDATDFEEAPKPKTRRNTNVRAPAALHEIEVDQTPLAARSSYASVKNNAPKALMKTSVVTKTKQSKAPQAIVSESRSEPDIEDGAADVSDIAALPLPKPKAHAGSSTRQDLQVRRRAGSASDTERGDPNLRRKLGDATRKFENIDLKYNNLKEVGILEANSNMEKLRRQCETTSQVSGELIASLKKELALQAPVVHESRKLKKELQAREIETAQLKSSAAELSSLLAAAQNEIKALQAKLSASRTAAASVESVGAKTPGSALKGVGQVRTVMVGSAEAAQAAQVAQMKEDLYSDLTGLIIRSVKRTEEGDTFDCIQTGRNGTLHFKLYIDQEDAKSASFEETEFLYTPLLDNNRDRELIELMPEYLTEDITFARQNAAKFYGRVVDTLTKRRAEE